MVVPPCLGARARGSHVLQPGRPVSPCAHPLPEACRAGSSGVGSSVSVRSKAKAAVVGAGAAPRSPAQPLFLPPWGAGGTCSSAVSVRFGGQQVTVDPHPSVRVWRPEGDVRAWKCVAVWLVLQH